MDVRMQGENPSTLATLLRRMLVLVVSLAAIASQPVGAQRSERGGQEVVGAVCAACHASGAQGAPRIGDQKAWAPLAARGLTSLTESALKGIRNMPPHGGNPGLSDIEIERAITYMVNQSGGKWTEPLSGLTPAAERRGEQIVQAQCASCHESGAGGAPRIGDQAAWVPRLKRGIDSLVRSAINGHGPMPPRGGMADLTDSELRGAIVYMLNPRSGAAKAPTAAMSAPSAANRKVVDGTEIHLGVVSAESIRAQYARNDKERAMHGGVPSGSDFYHVSVSLFEAKTQAVIADAQVEASVLEPGLGGATKKLEPVTFNGMASYGSYFRIPGKGTYTITVRVRHAGAPQPVVANFEFKR